MLVRSCQYFKIINKQCYGSLILRLNKRAPELYLRSPNLCCSFSSSANLCTADDFSDVINDLVKKDDRHSINHAYVQKLKNVNNLNVLEQFCVESRPSDSQEALLTLQRLSNLSYKKNGDQIMKFLKSENYVSSLSAQFLNDEVDIACLMEAAICLFNILDKLPDGKTSVNEDAPFNLTPNFDDFFAVFMKQLKQRITAADIEKLNPDTVIAFYRCLESKCYSEVDDKFVEEYKKVLELKIPDITSSATITALLTSLNKEHYQDESFIRLVTSKVEELSPNMLLGELINVFSTLAENGYRKLTCLTLLSEAIRNHTDVLSLSQLERLANGIVKISFYNPRLIIRYCADLINAAGSLSRWSQVSTILVFLTKARVSDEKVWQAILNWMNKASRSASMNDLRFCIGSLALMNVDQKLCSSFVKYFASRLQPTPNETPLKWLNTVWAVASLQCLTSKLAESVLNEEFHKELFSKQYSMEETMFIAQKLCQINAAANFDLKNYRGPCAKVDEFSFTPTACQTLKYGTRAEMYEEFLRNLNVPIPSAFVTSPRYYPEYGVFIDSLLYYNTKASKFDSISSVPKNDKLPLKGLIAVQYFNRRHFTASFAADDDDKIRLLGSYQMGLRHLKAAGAKVVIFDENELQKHPDKVNRIVFIKNQIMAAAQSG